MHFKGNIYIPYLILVAFALATYEHLRQGGFLQLPHQTTLSKYTSFTDVPTGFNPDILNRCALDMKIDEIPDYKTNVALLFDEMHIKYGLIFSRSSGKLIGFTELGDINDELNEFETRFNADTQHQPELATHVLTFMVRGLFTHFNYPIGYFPSKGFDSDQLFPCVWEAVRILEVNNFKVRAFICDGASPNRRFYRLHKLPNEVNVSVDGVVYWAWNLFAVDERKIYFISDPPHLIKTLRNNFENSHSHNNTRHLMVSAIL